MKVALKLGCLVAAVMLVCVGGEVANAGVELVSVGIGGAPANGPSPAGLGPSGLSTNGRYVVFTSAASNLVPKDTNHADDVFVRDRTKRTTRRVSVGKSGVQGNVSSGNGVISQNGRFVAFQSFARNLVPDDNNVRYDIFVRDLVAGKTERVSVATDGAQANGDSFVPSISADGRFVAFSSSASNLVPRDTNGSYDIFLHDRKKHATFRVSLGAPFSQANDFSGSPVLSQDARFVAFTSCASNLAPGDTNGACDVFVRDRRNQTIRRVSVTQTGAQSTGGGRDPAMSPNGRFVAFASDASDFVPRDTNGSSDIFVRDLQTNTTSRVSLGAGFAQVDGGNYLPKISADGKKVVFESWAGIVADDKNGVADIYLRDRRTQSIRRMSVPLPNVPGTGLSESPAISADGDTVVFFSQAPNLVPGDTNGVRDVFVATP
jgi:Tol biopolymer transport system component